MQLSKMVSFHGSIQLGFHTSCPLKATVSMFRCYLPYISRWHLSLNGRAKPVSLTLPMLQASPWPCKIQKVKRQDTGSQDWENLTTLLWLPFGCVYGQAPLCLFTKDYVNKFCRNTVLFLPPCWRQQRACAVIYQHYLTMQDVSAY